MKCALSINSSRKAGSNPSRPASLRPTVLDIAWAAGIFEGEGNCNLDGTTTRATVTQKDRWLLDRLSDLFGGNVHERRAQYVLVNGKRTTVTSWGLYGARARGFLMTIYLFLSPRRKEQVRRALGV